VKKNNLFLRNNIQAKYLKSNFLKKLLEEYKKNILDIKNDIGNSKKTLNILDTKFKFNFKIKDLKKFRKFKTIALVGMGGSILGSEAIYNFLEKKIKKKFIFLII
jgi:glucose-6-phosphate isomerase